MSRQHARRAAARNTGTASSSAPHNFLAQQNDGFEATEPTAGRAGLGRNYAKHKSFAFLPWNRVKKVRKREIFTVCNSTLKRHDYK